MWRIAEAGKEAVFSGPANEFNLHSNVLGNLLAISTFNKDLLAPFRNKALPVFLRKNIWKALLAYPEIEDEYATLVANNKAKTLSPNEMEITKKATDILSE
jgi:hypothetical protein